MCACRVHPHWCSLVCPTSYYILYIQLHWVHCISETYSKSQSTREMVRRRNKTCGRGRYKFRSPGDKRDKSEHAPQPEMWRGGDPFRKLKRENPVRGSCCRACPPTAPSVSVHTHTRCVLCADTHVHARSAAYTVPPPRDPAADWLRLCGGLPPPPLVLSPFHTFLPTEVAFRVCSDI